LKKIISAVISAALVLSLLSGCLAMTNAPADIGVPTAWAEVFPAPDGTSNYFGVVQQLQTEGLAGGKLVKYLSFASLDDVLAFLGVFLVEPKLPETFAAGGRLLLIYAEVPEHVLTPYIFVAEDNTAFVTVQKAADTDANAEPAHRLFILPLPKNITMVTVMSKV